MRRPRGSRIRQTNKCLKVESLESRAMLHAIGVLTGSVYFDVDGDGVQSDTEVGIPGIVVRLNESDSTDPATERSTITDGDGAYVFDELNEGTYQISTRQSRAITDGQGSSSNGSATTNVLSNITLVDDQELDGNDFTESSLRPEFINVGWFFASAPPAQQMLREVIALGEELSGDHELAASIRAGGTDVPDETDNTPIAADDAYTVQENQVLDRDATAGVLSNDVDLDGDSLTAILVDQPDNGLVTMNADGSFTYTPVTDFTGVDFFTYEVSDGTNTSNLASVAVTVTADVVINQPFGAVTPGQFDSPGLLGIRTDLVAGAPPITANHVDGDVDYTGYSNPPTYGNHHGFDPQGTDVNPGITPRPTGVYSTEQPDEDIIHNLEHGHVWISYNPSLISSGDLAALEQLVLDGTSNANGGGVGVILTPRAANDNMIALASWAHLQTLDSYDPVAIRDFVETNRGKAPEGFITP